MSKVNIPVLDIQNSDGTYFLCPIEKVIPALVDSNLTLVTEDHKQARRITVVRESINKFIELIGPNPLGVRLDKATLRNKALLDITEFLEKEGYIGKSMRKDMLFHDDRLTFLDSEVISFYLTGKGLDIYLKVQAHTDAEKRHNDTQRHNSMMRYLTLSSFILASISAIVAIKTSVNAQQNLELANKRYLLSEKQFELTLKELSKTKEGNIQVADSETGKQQEPNKLDQNVEKL